MKKFVLVLGLCSVAYAADPAPEIFADTVLRSEHPEVARLEEAFAVATRAQEPTRLTAIFGTPAESRAMYRSKAGELLLDRLSLQCRIVKAVLPLDPKKARELFHQITRPKPEPRPCEDPLVGDASIYYETAILLDRSEPFLKTVLSGIQSPNELAAFVHAIQSVQLKQTEWDSLLATLATKLETIDDDYRPFALSIGAMRPEIEALAKRSPASMLPLSFRTYLVAQMRAPRCAEDFGEAAQVVDWFNSSFRGDAPAIAEAETTPAKRGGAIQPAPYFEAEDSRGLGSALTRLQFGEDGKPRTPADRATAEWRKLQIDFLRDLDAWQPAGSAADVLHQKAYVFRAVLALTPPGPDRDQLVATFESFVKSSQAKTESPAEWLQVTQALACSLNDSAGQGLRYCIGISK
jgi:hypothetical protein